MFGHVFDIEAIRAFKEANQLTDLAFSRIAGGCSHVTVGKLNGENPALSLSSLRQLQGPLPKRPLHRVSAFDGKFSINRKVILSGDVALQADRDLVRCSLAALMLGCPLEVEGLAYHVVSPEEPIERSVFRRWQPVPGVDGGRDFTSSLIEDVPDPVIMKEFADDVQAVLNTLSSQFGLFHRRRVNPSSGEVSYRLFMRIMVPYIRDDDAFRIFVITRPQKIESALGLFPDLRIGTPHQGDVEGS